MAPRATTARALLAGFAILLAGCTAAPPAPSNAPTAVVLTTTEQSAAPGSDVHLAWELRGGSEGVTHSEVHWGPATVVDPTQGVYPSTAPGTLGGGGRYTATVTMPAGGVLYARAHVTAAGLDLWSGEVLVRALVGARFLDVQIPRDVEAGVPFNITYRAEASGSTSHIGAHFSTTSSAQLPEHFAPSAWSGLRTSQHLGAPTAVQLPRDIAVTATIPSPGTWYVRPHVLLGSENWWGAEVTVTATDPSSPNIQLLAAPVNGAAGDPVTVEFQVNSQPVTSTHVGAHYGQDSSADLAPGFLPTEWPSARRAPHAGEQAPVPLPGPFRLNITFPLPGTWYYRAHAIVGGQQVWSSEVAINLTLPPQPRVVLIDPPRNHTIEVGTNARVNPLVLEWAVLAPANASIGHTDVHHGPASVATPAETGPQSYAQKTPAQNGTAPALFRANVTVVTGFPAVSGSYYVRAMAVVPGEGGQPTEVWSDEWAVQVNVRTT